MIPQSYEIDHSECHCGGGRHAVSQICQARSPDKNLVATDPRAPVNRERWCVSGSDLPSDGVFLEVTSPSDGVFLEVTSPVMVCFW